MENLSRRGLCYITEWSQGGKVEKSKGQKTNVEHPTSNVERRAAEGRYQKTDGRPGFAKLLSGKRRRADVSKLLKRIVNIS